MSFLSVPAIILAAVALHVGSHHLLVFVSRPRPRWSLTFALLCYAVVVYDILCAGLYSVDSPQEGVQWQRLQSIALALGAIALVWFVADYTGRRARRIPILISAAYAVVIVVGLVGGNGLLWTDLPSVKAVNLPFGIEFHYYEMTSGPLTDFQSLLVLLVFGYAIRAGIDQVRSGERGKGGALLVATTLFFLGVASDTAVATGLYVFVYTIEYSFMAFVILMTVFMTKEVLRSADIEAALRQSEERLKLALEGANAGLWDFALDSEKGYYSDRWFRMLGYEPDDFPHTYETFLGLLHPEDREEVDEVMADFLSSTDDYFYLEFRMRAKDGGWRWINSRGKVVRRTEGGGTGRVIGTHLDITPRKEVEAALRESEERFRSLVRSSPMGIFMYELEEDDRLVLIDANPAADRITGAETRKHLGKTIEEAFPPLAETEVPERYRRAARDGVPWSIRQMPYEDPEIRGAYDIHAFQTVPGRMAVMFQDVTDRIRAEEQVRQSQKMQAVGRLAGGVAHDFNNLLQAIRGYTELCLASLPEGQRVRGHLVEVGKAAERASSLTRQLLAFSRQDALKPKHLDLNDLITDLMKMLRRVIGEHVELVIHSQPGLRKILADPGQVEQIVMNLCINARDAMPDGGVLTLETGHVRFTPDFCEKNPWATAGEFVGLTVADTGRGIPLEIQDRIYEPFYTTKDVGEGVGLGLATVYAIVERHGGLITMASSPGSGTEFRIFFPVSDRPEEEDSAARQVEPEPRGGTETILIAEDDESVRNLAVTVLGEAGYQLVVARDGEEAIRLFEGKADDIDLALLDVIMPRKGGREVMNAIRALRPEVPVVFSTGYGGRRLDIDRLSDGHAELIHKAYTPRDLLRKVREVLDAG